MISAKPLPQVPLWIALRLLLPLLFFTCHPTRDVVPAVQPDPNLPADTTLAYLALGDSYTIGTSVAAEERWPVQLAATLLTREGVRLEPLEIVARNGWRTDNLANALAADPPGNDWDLVSLLIGVNDQYQGFDAAGYAARFRALLDDAIRYARGDTAHVFVVSIPDYAYTPFGGGNADISRELDEFNAIARAVCEEYGVPFLDIVPISRQGLDRPELVAGDNLHPSGLQYGRWVDEVIASAVAQMIARWD